MSTQPDEQAIKNYLVGAASEAETERLDEMSVADDDFAARLQAAENDLVDAYVKGELSGETLARFNSFYLASPRRREKVRFAETMVAFADRKVTGESWAGVPTNQGVPSERSGFFFKIPRVMLQWGFATAALILLIAAGSLLYENIRLRNQMSQALAERATLEQRESELQSQLNERRSANAEAENELERVRERLAQLEQLLADQQHGKADQRELKVIAFTLSPQTRGIGQIATLSIPAQTDYIVLNLELETNEFAAYQAALKNPATSRVVWRSGSLKPGGNSKTVRVRLPGSLLNQQYYIVELSGVSDSASEMLSSYTFKVVIK